MQDCSNSHALALELVQSCTLLHCRYNLTKLPLSPSHNWFWNVFLFTKWDDHWSFWKIVISFINPKCLLMYLRLGPFCAKLDYDSVRPPSGWYAQANIGVKWDHESTTLSVKHTKIYLFSSISQNLHIISKTKPRWSFCWQISEFGCSHHPSPGMAMRDARHVAIATQGYGYYNLRPTNR